MKRINKLSITSQLVIGYVLTSMAFLVISNALVYRHLTEDLRAQNQKRFENVALLLIADLNTAKNISDIAEEIALRYATEDKTLLHHMRILAPDGGIITESPGMGRQIPVSAFPPAINSHAIRINPPQLRKWEELGQYNYHLGALNFDIANICQDCTLQLAYDSTSNQNFLTRYRRIEMIILLATLLATGITGTLIVRHGLKPIYKIKAIAAQIDGNNFHERLGQHYWPKEINNLALSFDRMLDRLEYDYSRLSHFSTNMAHEFRTPLTNLIGEAEVTLARERSAEEYKQSILSSLEEYQRLANLSEKLLFLARAENKNESLTKKTIELSGELLELADYYQPMAEEHDVTVEVAPCERILLCADATLFRRAVGNLLANAIHYSQIKGQVILSAEKRTEGVAVIIHDNGLGIAKEEQQHLFERFYRVEDSRQCNPQGTGLGLAIVQSIMELHGGTLSLESAPERGTTATLFFPA